MRMLALSVLCAAALAGCTREGLYNTGQRHAEAECSKRPGDAYQRCKDGLKRQSYEDYERERTGAKP